MVLNCMYRAKPQSVLRYDTYKSYKVLPVGTIALQVVPRPSGPPPARQASTFIPACDAGPGS